MTAPTDLAQALRELTEACEAEYCSADTDGEGDDSKVAFPEESCSITFGMIRRARAALNAHEPRAPTETHPEDSCERCGGKNIKPWFAPSPLWNKIADKDWSIICPQCFVELARETGIDPTAWRLAPEDYDGPNDDPARTHGYTWVENGSLQLLEERARVMTSLRNEEVWYWQGDGFDFPESLSCPVVISADQLRKMLASAPAQPASVADVLYTREEVCEAMEILRRFRSSIPDDCLNQMEAVLIDAAPQPAKESE